MSTVHAIVQVLESGTEAVVNPTQILATEVDMKFTTTKLPLIAGGYYDWPVALPHAWLPC